MDILESVAYQPGFIIIKTNFTAWTGKRPTLKHTCLQMLARVIRCFEKMSK